MFVQRGDGVTFPGKMAGLSNIETEAATKTRVTDTDTFTLLCYHDKKVVKPELRAKNGRVRMSVYAVRTLLQLFWLMFQRIHTLMPCP